MPHYSATNLFLKTNNAEAMLYGLELKPIHRQCHILWLRTAMFTDIPEKINQVNYPLQLYQPTFLTKHIQLVEFK